MYKENSKESQALNEKVDLRALKILFTGGGSGGPTIPLSALAQELRRNVRHGKQNLNTEFLFLGSKSGPERKMVEQAEIPFAAIPAGKLRRYWSWRNFIDPLFIFGGAIAGAVHLLHFRPDVVVSAGSFVSVPVAYVAWFLRIPHIILQMDVRSGLANRLMAPVSSALVHYFEHTANQFPSIPLKRQIGPVVRQEIYSAQAERANVRFGLHPKRPLLLITGGGQGASGLNRAVRPLLEHWLKSFQIVHLTGSKDKISEFARPEYHPLEAVHEGMGDLLARSELVLTRAGMGILGELATLRKDAVLIPLPGTHQEENARIIQENGAAEFVSQEVLVTQGLEASLIWWNRFWQQRIPGETGEKLHQFLPENGSKDFAKLLLEVVGSRRNIKLCASSHLAMIFLLLFILSACTSGGGKLYDWCKKRDFPPVCQKFFDH